MSSDIVLAADIGGTHIRAAIIDSSGHISHEQRIEAHLSGHNYSENDIIHTLSTLFQGMIEQHPKTQAIGMGFPGFFIGHTGILAASPNLTQLHHVPLASLLSQALSLPVMVQNDALCAAMGEYRFGAGKGQNNLLHITLGTGIGGGLILNNMPYTGEGGMAMEFGHLRTSYSDDARLCGCGGYGCVEAYASATALIAQYFEHTGISSTPQDMHTLACQGDMFAKQLFEQAGKHLGRAIAEAVKLLDVRTVTISGGLIGAWSILEPAIQSSLEDNLISPLKGKVHIFASSLQDHAGLLGAAALTTLKV